MLNGIIHNNRPLMKIVIAGIDAQNVQDPTVLVDTGFTGDLKVSGETAQNLRLTPTGVEYVTVGHGQNVPMLTALALVALSSTTRLVNVLIADGDQAVGIGLLKKFSFKLFVNTPLNIISVFN